MKPKWLNLGKMVGREGGLLVFFFRNGAKLCSLLYKVPTGELYVVVSSTKVAKSVHGSDETCSRLSRAVKVVGPCSR